MAITVDQRGDHFGHTIVAKWIYETEEVILDLHGIFASLAVSETDRHVTGDTAPGLG